MDTAGQVRNTQLDCPGDSPNKGGSGLHLSLPRYVLVFISLAVPKSRFIAFLCGCIICLIKSAKPSLWRTDYWSSLYNEVHSVLIWPSLTPQKKRCLCLERLIASSRFVLFGCRNRFLRLIWHSFHSWLRMIDSYDLFPAKNRFVLSFSLHYVCVCKIWLTMSQLTGGFFSDRRRCCWFFSSVGDRQPRSFPKEMNSTSWFLDRASPQNKELNLWNSSYIAGNQNTS